MVACETSNGTLCIQIKCFVHEAPAKSLNCIKRMEARTWTIVQFVEDGVVEAVPSTWVQDDKCHWPLLTKDNLKNAIKECKPLNTSWPSYKIEMSRNCTFDDFAEARSKVKEKNDFSSPQSESESLHEKKRKPECLSSGDESVDFNDSLPIRIKEIKTDESDDEIKVHDIMINRLENNIGNENINSCRSCVETDKYLATIIEQNHLLQGLVTDVLNEVRSLKYGLNIINNVPQKQSLFERYAGLKFPLDSEEQLHFFEYILNNKEDFEDGINELSKIGGTNNYQFVKRVLTLLMTNNLALQYSWLGRKGKREFHNLKTASLVICAAEKSKIAENRRQSEISIQLWLKRACDRKMALTKNF